MYVYVCTCACACVCVRACVCIRYHALFCTESYSQIYSQLTSGSNVTLAWLAIACFLVSAGADLGHKNRAGKSPLDEVADAKVRDLLIKYKLVSMNN